MMFLARILMEGLISYTSSIAALFEPIWSVPATAVCPATEDSARMNYDGLLDWRHDGGLHWYVPARKVIRWAS